MDDIILYASDIVGLSVKSDYDTNTVMNGLAIASASLLLDTVVDDEYRVDEEELEASVQKYVSTLRKALAFAKSELASVYLEEKK